MDATDTTTLKPKSIGLIIASTRQKRLGPSVAELVQSSILDALSSVPEHQRPRLQLIDLADHALPWFDEPEPPMSIKDPAKYTHEHTRRWSATIAAHDAFVFVTPQYNWSIPGVLKNALDFLYNEWSDKPALIVSYGARGGGKAQEALRAVLQGLRMRPLDEAVGLPLSELKGGAFAVIGAAALSNPEEAWKGILERLEILVQEQWL